MEYKNLRILNSQFMFKQVQSQTTALPKSK